MEMITTTKSATFMGTKKNLDMFIACGIKYASEIKYNRDFTAVKIVWICENENHDIHDDIDLEEMEKWNIEILSINN